MTSSSPATAARAGVAARVAAVVTHVPQAVLTNAELERDFPGWTAAKILEKTGIRERRIAAPGETALDLGLEACRKLFASGACAPETVDFLIFCSQAGDYILPTSACILQERLGLPTSVGAVDINLGCSGFVYGLSLASGLIASGSARNVLLVTADTYSKYINKADKSVRTLFGDGAAATLVTAADAASGARIGPFIFGTDGRGAKDLIVEAGGFRLPATPDVCAEEADRSGNVRGRHNLYMNGAAVMGFTLREVPKTFQQVLAASGTTPEDYDFVILHQANKFMLDALAKKLPVPAEKVPRLYEDIGNTVSSTIPFVLASLQEEGRLRAGARIMLIGFGVGLSWAGASLIL